MTTVEEYMKLPYHIWMVRDEAHGEVGWVVGVEEFNGCLSEGDTPAEAATMIQEAMELWLESMVENGQPIPPPRADSSHSGKFQLRVPTGLHAELDTLARAQGVSLNALVNNLLAGAIGWSVVAKSADSPAVHVLETRHGKATVAVGGQGPD